MFFLMPKSAFTEFNDKIQCFLFFIFLTDFFLHSIYASKSFCPDVVVNNAG